MLRRLFALFVLLLPLLAGADNLTVVKKGALPALPVLPETATLLQVTSVDGRLLALGGERNWLLDAAGKRWQRLAWAPEGKVLRASGAFLLMADAGGEAAERALRLQVDGYAVSTTAYKPLPVALHGAFAAQLGQTLYVAGSATRGMAMYALKLDEADAPWQLVPGSGLETAPLTSMAAQNSTLLLSLQGGQVLRWRARDGWAAALPTRGEVVPGAAWATGQAHVLYLVRPAPAAPAQLWSYHTITKAWARQSGELGGADGMATGWANGMLWTSPEGEFTTLELSTDKRLLKTLDWIVIVAYLGGMLGIGWYYYSREKRTSTSEFFVGGRSIPFWAAGISLYAANTSSISYIAIPAKAFETNWQYMTNNLIAVVALTFVAIVIVPVLRRLNLMSVFQYLEIRFHPAIRMLASLICILVQIGSRMSVILLLPSLAIATITGIDVTYSILLMGGFTIAYTAMGGMKAVVWTDFAQLFVKMGGALFAIGFIIWQLDGGVGEFVATAAAENKTRLFDFSWDLTQPTVWGFVFLVIFDVVLTFPKDQVLMQRALSTKSAPEATRAILTFAAISIPGGFIFYTIGTSLFAFYQAHPERMNPLLNIDATFPLFIAAELPMGITGLIIAGILAAAMATLSSIMNSVATLASVDFYEKLVKNPSPEKSVLFAELATVATGIVGVLAALWLSRFNSHSLFDVSIELAGLLGGGFAGAYTLGMFTRRANWQGVALGIGGSTALTTLAWSMNLVHPYFYLPISIMLCISLGYVLSYLFPAPRQSLAGLTIYADK